MIRAEYWISGLAALAGVSTRTIRYYIDEGLLPQPEIRGKYAVFTDEYMHRLKLIKYLKDAYLPLQRIRALLDTLNDSQIVPLLSAFETDPVGALASLQALPVFSQPEPLPSAPPASALDYIQQVSSENRVMESRKSFLQSNLNQPVFNEPTPSEWQHVELLPGLELHVKQPAPRHIRRLVRMLVEMVKNDQTRNS